MKPKNADSYVQDPPGENVLLNSPALTVADDERFEAEKRIAKRKKLAKRHTSRKKSAKKA